MDVATYQADLSQSSDADLAEWTSDLIARRFERCVASFPDAPACVDADGCSTYRAINDRANLVASRLLHTRGDSEEPVALLFEHGAASLVGIMGVLKAGKIVTSLDASWPANRLAWMLDDAGAQVIVSNARNEALARALAGPSRDVILLESLEADRPFDDPPQTFAPNRLAYLLYTSGSTGTPKGIVHTHKTALHNIGNYTHLLKIDARDRLTWLHSASFSSAWIEMLCALLNGASLCAWNVRALGVAGLAQWLNRNHVTVMHWAPSPLRQLVESMRNSPGLATPRLLVLGSEAVLKSDWEAYCRCFPNDCVMVNRLGATEVNNYRLFFLDKSTVPTGSTIPGGYHVPGKEVTLIDETGAPVPAGTVGEVVVRSRYSSPGYWKRPDLTRAAYRQDPSDPEATFYRTGDLGALRADGCLDFRGRADHQIKVRGHRIEVAEIENALAQQGTLTAAAVVSRNGSNGEPRLVAYIVPREGAADFGALRAFLRKRLPDHMFPNQFVALSHLPTTETGKVDRNALPAPPEAGRPIEGGYVPPRTGVEEQLIPIWEQVLGHRPIGVHDDFFELGGHSLLGIRLFAQIESIFGVRLPLEILLKESTIARLAAAIEMPDRERHATTFVAIQPNGTKPPLFVLPSAAGKLLFWRKLLPYLDPDMPVLGLWVPDSNDDLRVHPDFESLAALFAGQLIASYPEGSFRLAGYSFSGRLAYELARQLHERGRRVSFLGLIDSRATSKVQDRSFRERLALVPAFFRNIPYWLIDDIRRSRPRSLLWRFRRSLHAVVQAIVGRRLSRRLQPAKRQKVLPGHLRAVKQTYLAGSGRYVPRPYPGCVTLFRARSHLLFSPDTFDFGWGRIAGSVDVRVVARCRHSAMVDEPYVGGVTRAVQAAIDASESSSTAAAGSARPVRSRKTGVDAIHDREGTPLPNDAPRDVAASEVLP